MKPIYQLFIPLLFSITLLSCEKVIDVKLKNAEPSIVIVGNIDNQAGPYTVSISKTVHFDKNNDFPAIDDALVIINDDLGNTDTLLAKGNGIYQTQSIVGVPGRNYTLSVFVGAEIYTAQSKMPIPVPFDSLGSSELTGFGDPVFFPLVFFSDPAATANQYRFIAYINNKKIEANFVRSDRLNNGLKAEVTLRNQDLELIDGDSISVVMQCVDKKTYEYFNTLNNADGSSQSAAPADPNNNLSNKALGYFSAHSSQTRKIIFR